jgi:hypothetical protein
MFSSRLHLEEAAMGKGLLLWLVGVPIPVIILRGCSSAAERTRQLRFTNDQAPP